MRTRLKVSFNRPRFDRRANRKLHIVLNETCEAGQEKSRCVDEMQVELELSNRIVANW